VSKTPKLVSTPRVTHHAVELGRARSRDESDEEQEYQPYFDGWAEHEAERHVLRIGKRER